jgi:hypothetical protein
VRNGKEISVSLTGKYREMGGVGRHVPAQNLLKSFVEADYLAGFQRECKKRAALKEKEARGPNSKAAWDAEIEAAVMAENQPGGDHRGPAQNQHEPDPPPPDNTKVPGGRKHRRSGDARQEPELHQAGGWTGAPFHAQWGPVPPQAPQNEVWAPPPRLPLITCQCKRPTTSIAACGCQYAQQLRHLFCVKCGGWGHTTDRCSSYVIV